MPDGTPTQALTLEQLERHCDLYGLYGGEVEYWPQHAVYRCPDFDPCWRAWPDVHAAVAYYEQLAR